jgi:hypothetical protein
MGIVDNVKDTVKIVQQLDNIELYRKILDLQSEAIELTEQLKQKDQTISKLKDALSLKETLICKDSSYFATDEKGEIVDGPFCTKCFDIDNTLCRILPVDRPDNPEVRCPKCKVPYHSWAASNYFNRK